MRAEHTAQRILHIPRRFTVDEWGGTETVVTQLCRQQKQDGWQPEIHTSLALSKKARETIEGIPVRRYRYSYPFCGLSTAEIHALDKKGGNLLSFDLFAGLLTRPDVRLFHAHVTKRMGGIVATAARLRRKPCVVTLHGNHFDVPAAEAQSVVAPQQGKLEWGKPFGKLFGSRHLLETCDAVLCVGRSEFEAARAALPHDRVFYLPNGVHVDAFSTPPEQRQARRHALGIRESDFLFGCISRIDPQKDQKLLIDAFASLHAQHPQARLLLCGPVTSETYLGELRQTISQRGIDACVRLLPAVKAGTPEHASTFAALDAFVLPSRHEPFGIVVLEAWASRKPVITTRAGGLDALVSHTFNGLKIPPGDAEALAAAMAQLVASPSFASYLAEQGHHEARSRYTWEAVASKLETVYQQAESRHAQLTR